MTNPFQEAAQRHCDKWASWIPAPSMEDAEGGAEEALAPIRKLHQSDHWIDPESDAEPYCVQCMKKWPCPTARLVYAEEELT